MLMNKRRLGLQTAPFLYALQVGMGAAAGVVNKELMAIIGRAEVNAGGSARLCLHHHTYL